MTIRITLTVETTNHGNAITLTETHVDGGSNPRYDGDTVRRGVSVLTEHVAAQLDKLVDGNRLRVGPCGCICQEAGGFCGGCGHAGCGGRR